MLRRITPQNSKTTAAGYGCFILFGLPFLLAGLAVSFIQVRMVWKAWTVQSWVETPCRIESASLETRGSSHEAKADYSYRYGGMSYRSQQVTVSGGADNLGTFQTDAAEELLAHQRSGQPFRCYVNPDHPESAVLYKMTWLGLPSFLLIFALTFPAAGAGVMAMGWFGARSALQSASLKALNPGQPWRWKQPWAGSVIPAEGRVFTAAWTAYIIWSGLVIWPLVIVFVRSGELLHPSLMWLVLLFPLLWLLITYGVLNGARKRTLYGRAGFAPSAWPGTPGGGLRGALVFGRALPQQAEVVATLLCERQITRSSGDGSTTTKETVWSQEVRVPTMLATSGPEGTRVPVGFSIPSDVPETDMDGGPTKHVWMLRARVSGTPLEVTMEVPVFNTDASVEQSHSSSIAPAQKSFHATIEEELPQRLAESGVGLTLGANNLPLMLDPSSGRPKGVIGFLVFFDLIWSAAFVVMLINKAPILFILIWGLSSAAIWVSIVWMLLHRRSVQVEADSIRIRHILGPFRRWEEILPKSEIREFVDDCNMTSGSRSFYRVSAKLKGGKSSTIADGISGSVVTEALTRRFNRWLV